MADEVRFGARRVVASMDLTVDSNITDAKLQEWLASTAGSLRDDFGGVRSVDNVQINTTNDSSDRDV